MSRDVILKIHSGDIFGDMLRTNVMYIHIRRWFSRDNSGDIFGDMLRTNVIYIHVQRCYSGDTFQRYFWRYALDQCDVYPCPEMFLWRCFSTDNSGDIFRDMLRTNVMYIHVWRCYSGDTLRRYFWRYAPDQCDVYPCLEMVFRRYTPEIFLEICSGPM